MHTILEAFTFLKYFFQYVITQYSKMITNTSIGSLNRFIPKLQKIRSDNGKEFLSKKIQIGFSKTAFTTKEVVFTPPQQNGVVE